MRGKDSPDEMSYSISDMSTPFEMPKERPIISFLVNIIGNHHYFTLEHERVKINQFLTAYFDGMSKQELGFSYMIDISEKQSGLFDMQIVCLDHVDYSNFNGRNVLIGCPLIYYEIYDGYQEKDPHFTPNHKTLSLYDRSTHSIGSKSQAN